MTPNKWQLKAMVTGKKLTTGSDWDGKGLGEIYLTLRKQGVANQAALEVVEAIKDNRLWAMSVSQIPHVSQDQAFSWLVESRVDPYQAANRVWDKYLPADVVSAISAVWSKLNAEHRQELADARTA